MTAWIIIGIILLFFVFLLSLKATVTIAYAGEVQLFLRVLCFKIKLVPAKKKKYPQSMSAKKAKKIKAKAAKKRAKKLAKKEAKEREKEEEKKAIAKGVDYILTDRILPEGYDKNGSILDNPQDHIITILPEDTVESDLPEEFTLTLDFTKGWPFVEAPSTTFVAEGEEYTYSYKYDDAKAPVDVRFVITTRGKGSYSYVAPSDGADGYLAMPTEAATTNRFGAISIPPFIDRYPRSVDVSTNKGWLVGTGGFSVFGTVSGSTTSAKTFPVNKYSSEETFILPVGTQTSTLRDYSIGIRFTDTFIYKISITYTKTKPE